MTSKNKLDSLLIDFTLVKKSCEAVKFKPEFVGHLVSKKGRNIQAMSKKFKIIENTARITGMPDDVQMSCKEVELLFPKLEDKYSEDFEVSSQHVGFSIGREGSRIKSIRSAHMVNIKINQHIQGDELVQIYGDEQNVKSARREIEEIVIKLTNTKKACKYIEMRLRLGHAEAHTVVLTN